MTRRALAVVLVVAILLAPTTPAHAIGETGQLVQILALLYKAEKVIKNINGVMESMRDRILVMNPMRANQELLHWFQQVRTIKEELEQMSCDWQFTVPVQKFWDGIFDVSGSGFCKPELRGLFGAPHKDLPGADIEEWYDASSTVRLRSLGTRVAHDEAWAEYAQRLAWEASQPGNPYGDEPYGPAYSRRLSAQALSLLGVMSIEHGDTRAMELWLLEQEWMDERQEDRRERALALTTLGLAAGRTLDQLDHELATGIPIQ